MTDETTTLQAYSRTVVRLRKESIRQMGSDGKVPPLRDVLEALLDELDRRRRARK